MYLDDKKQRLSIKWRFLSSNIPPLFGVDGDLVYIRTSPTDFDIKILQGGQLVTYEPPQGWKVTDLIITDRKGVQQRIDEFIFKPRKYDRLKYFLEITKCCGEPVLPCEYSYTTIDIQADTDTIVPPQGFEFSDIITVNGVVQEMHPGLQIQSVDSQGVITFNSEYSLYAGDVIVFRKCIGSGISTQVAQSDSSTFQAPQGFEDYTLLTVNGIVQEVHPSMQIQSIVNGLITFNSEYFLTQGDVLVFRK